jgi:hypothetical protein
MRWEGFSFVAALAAGGQIVFASAVFAGPHDALIAKHAAANGLPESLVRRVIQIESRGNATAVHRGNYGLMQIRLGTARGVGYSGDAKGLLDPDTNLTYAVRYLAGAYRAAGCDADRAVSYYKRGYYGAAQRECGGAALARLKPLPPAVTPVDVIKPKVVRTETIAAPNSGIAPTRPVGNFEPARIAPPPVQPVAIASATAAKQDPASKTETRADRAKGALKMDIAKPAAAEPTEKLELVSIPMPPVRPEFDAAPKPAVKSLHRSDRLHRRADNKFMAVAQSKAGSKSKTDAKPKSDAQSKSDDPVGVVSFLKKLVTPDKNTRKPVAEAQADPPSQMQPPQ